MEFKKAKKLLRSLALIYFLLAAMIFFVAGDGFQYEIVNGSMLSQTSVIGEIVDGLVVEQQLPVGADHAEAVNIMVTTLAGRIQVFFMWISARKTEEPCPRCREELRI